MGFTKRNDPARGARHADAVALVNDAFRITLAVMTSVAIAFAATTLVSPSPAGAAAEIDETCDSADDPSCTEQPTTTSDFSNTDSADLATAYVSGIPADDPDGGLVVRSGPSTSDTQLRVLPNDTTVIAVSLPESGTWVEIISPVRGWVGTRYLTTTPPTDLTTTTIESDTGTEASSDDESADTDSSILGSEILDDFDVENGTEPGELAATDEALPSDAVAQDLETTDEPKPADPETEESGNGSLLIFGAIGLAICAAVVALMRRSASSENVNDSLATTQAPVAPVAPVEDLPSGEQLVAAASAPLPQRQRNKLMPEKELGADPSPDRGTTPGTD